MFSPVYMQTHLNISTGVVSGVFFKWRPPAYNYSLFISAVIYSPYLSKVQSVIFRSIIAAFLMQDKQIGVFYCGGFYCVACNRLIRRRIVPSERGFMRGRNTFSYFLLSLCYVTSNFRIAPRDFPL